MHVILAVLVIFYIGPDKVEHVALASFAAGNKSVCEEEAQLAASQWTQKPGVVYVQVGCIEATDTKDKAA